MPAVTEYKCDKCGHSDIFTSGFSHEGGHSHIQCSHCQKIVTANLHDGVAVCPNCGEDPTSGDSFDPNKFNCPDCGSTMRKEEGSTLFLHTRRKISEKPAEETTNNKNNSFTVVAVITYWLGAALMIVILKELAPGLEFVAMLLAAIAFPFFLKSARKSGHEKRNS